MFVTLLQHPLPRPDLDDHCEGVMHLRLGLMSLARLALEVVEQLVATEKLDKREVEQLPKRLVDMIFGEKIVEASARATSGGDGEETQYCRERLRAGV